MNRASSERPHRVPATGGVIAIVSDYPERSIAMR